jgi:hypothetical protein
MAVHKIPMTNQRGRWSRNCQLVALLLLAASLPPVNASNTGRRQWLSYFGFSTVEGYDCLVFAGCIERNGRGNHRHSNDDPEHYLLFHDRLLNALAVDDRADAATEGNPTPNSKVCSKLLSEAAFFVVKIAHALAPRSLIPVTNASVNPARSTGPALFPRIYQPALALLACVVPRRGSCRPAGGSTVWSTPHRRDASRTTARR